MPLAILAFGFRPCKFLRDSRDRDSRKTLIWSISQFISPYLERTNISRPQGDPVKDITSVSQRRSRLFGTIIRVFQNLETPLAISFLAMNAENASSLSRAPTLALLPSTLLHLNAQENATAFPLIVPHRRPTDVNSVIMLSG